MSICMLYTYVFMYVWNSPPPPPLIPFLLSRDRESLSAGQLATQQSGFWSGGEVAVLNAEGVDEAADDHLSIPGQADWVKTH